MKYPWGRRVSTATCTPGLPSVVSGLFSSSSLPALPPESSWIAPSGWLGLPAAGARCRHRLCLLRGRFHGRGAQHHGLFEVGLLRRGGRGGLADELELVFA